MSDDLEYFENFRACAFLRASYARAARTDGRNSVFLSDFDSWYIKDWYSLIFNHFWQITIPCELIKVRNPRVRLWANTCKNHVILCWALAPQNAAGPPFFITCMERLWVVDLILCRHLPANMLWRHHNVIQSQKIGFEKNEKRFSKFNSWYLSNFHSIFFEFSICYSWVIALPTVYSSLFILTILSWSKLGWNLFCQKISCLRVMSMGNELSKNPELTW